MQRGFLSQYFDGVAVKRLSAVEVNTSVSNQHEFNGSRPLRNLLGDSRQTFNARFLWLYGENEGITSDGSVTWYDARENHPTRSEYRLYFKRNDVMDRAGEGDLIIVAKRPDNEIYIIVVPANSTMENQLLWLFGFDQVHFSFNFQPIEYGQHNPEIDFAVRYILDELGIEIEEPDTEHLDTILEPYLETGFPTTSDFSSLARKTLTDVSPIEDPDDALLKWMEHEEKLFRRLERHIIAKRLREGFAGDNDTTDVEGFIKFSLSVHNRRKSRVGHALENHLEEIFKVHRISYSRNEITENKSRPDFIFPGINFYHDQGFPAARLTMLGVKSTCKDRWRQVLAEAERIRTKHLFTLEPGISESQTSEMRFNNLQLVLPLQLHDTYKRDQRDWLMSFNYFIELVKERQQ
jgi:hypothetical protein